MKSVVELRILGQRLAIRSDEDEGSVRAVEGYLAERIEEVRRGSKAVATLDLALLAALNIAGELIKAREKLQNVEKKSAELGEHIERRLP
ncbi:MAG: cell division protein ZapA [Deltaproteobacteria bacterium]|nr:cell division protein ZapA [Deltaproteobacteria bacterium]